MKIEIKNSDDLISDSIDAFYSGDEEYASLALKDAIAAKLENHFCNCLAPLYGQRQ